MRIKAVGNEKSRISSCKYFSGNATDISNVYTPRGWRAVDISNRLLLSQEAKITFYPLTQPPLGCTCSVTGCMAATRSDPFVRPAWSCWNFILTFFCSAIYLASGPSGVKLREHGRVKYDKASERASSSIHGRRSKRSRAALHGKIKSNRFHWQDTILGVVGTRYNRIG